MTLTVIPQIQVTDSMLTASSLAEETRCAPWSASTSYATDNQAWRAETHSVYVRLAPGGVSSTPPEADPTNWKRTGPTNRWAVFDRVVGTRSVSDTGSMSWTISPGICTALALLDLSAAAVHIVMNERPGGPVVFDQTYRLTKNTSRSWSDYFFSDIMPRTALYVKNLPPFKSASITVTITGAGTVSAGVLVVGKAFKAGKTLEGLQASITDYSLVEEDEFGAISIAERPYAKRMSLSSIMPRAEFDVNAERFAKLRARPSVIIGNDGLDATMVYGFPREWAIDVPMGQWCRASLTVKGLI